MTKERYPTPSFPAQLALRWSLSDQWMSRAIGRRARQVLVRCCDPLVEIDVAGTRLMAPLSHELPRYRRLFEHYDTALPRLARHLQTAFASALPVIDVGANIGDSAAALLALPRVTVLAIEGNQRFFRLLAANATRWENRLVPVQCLLGEKTGDLAASIDAHRGTGRIQPSEDTVSVRTLSDLVVEYPAFREAKLVKIDTDGFDIAILRGARTWLATTQPVLFFEYDPNFWRTVTPDGSHVFRELAEVGYGPLLAYDNFGWLLWSSTVQDRRRLEELDAWLKGRQSSVYVDLCVFPADNFQIFEQFREAELRHFCGAIEGPAGSTNDPV